MAVKVLNRVVVVVGLSALALAGQSVRLDAQPPKQEHQKKQKEAKPAKAAKTTKGAEHAPPHGRGRLSPQDQQELIRLHERSLAMYREQVGRQQRLAEPRSMQLQEQKRKAQYRSEQQYLARLRQQQARVESQGRYNYSADPYFYTPPSYRYSIRGRDYETNQYGVDLLRRAVNYGYDEGRRAGLADRQDRWDSNYQDPYAYQDATYGYRGFYVDREAYNNYFREGFRRGYEDGHGAGSRYGSYANGKGTILGAVLAAILNFQPIQ